MPFVEALSAAAVLTAPVVVYGTAAVRFPGYMYAGRLPLNFCSCNVIAISTELQARTQLTNKIKRYLYLDRSCGLFLFNF